MNTPQRPDSSVVNKAIPLVYVGRNHDGFWVALDADTRVGGLFLFRSGALRFGHRRRNGTLSATMEMAELELPGRNRGNPLVGYLASRKARRQAAVVETGTSIRQAVGRVSRLSRASRDCARFGPHPSRCDRARTLSRPVQDLDEERRRSADRPVAPRQSEEFIMIRQIPPVALAVHEAARWHEPALRVAPNPHLEALARFAKIAGAVAALVLVMVAVMAIDVAIWVPHVRP